MIDPALCFPRSQVDGLHLQLPSLNAPKLAWAHHFSWPSPCSPPTAPHTKNAREQESFLRMGGGVCRLLREGIREAKPPKWITCWRPDVKTCTRWSRYSHFTHVEQAATYKAYLIYRALLSLHATYLQTWRHIWGYLKFASVRNIQKSAGDEVSTKLLSCH